MNDTGLPMRVWQHMRTVWPRYTLLPIVLFVGWPLSSVMRGECRWEFAVSVLFGAVLPYVGPRSKRLSLGLIPMGVLGILYDLMHYVQNVGVTRERVHLCDLHAFELRHLGVTSHGVRMTVQDYLQAHATLPLDLFFAVPYGTFIGAYMLLAVVLYFRDYGAMRRFTMAFLVMSIAGFVTYHLYPAAAPWYYRAHGCVVDPSAHASEGQNLARVDAWLGFPYFNGFYGRSRDVFGAMPSLHVAYPVLMVVEGWRALGTFRRFAIVPWLLRGGVVFYAFWMVGAAVYLDHHWISDILVGIAYGLLTFFGIRAFVRWRSAHGEPASDRTTRTATA